ncbi:MAG: aminotransferase class I/II-fold pyridoxal phosphate-dependent enzyme [Peptoniphilus sp.]|nr:aminotransferase class I/II-fold pyridoxal phosphate-dependent enzyme [Peptoniphilus sp.]MDD7363199.1 aminotransferase class I/II-fold pyridoxal phosphate-dependent enzyme [Bacillota bacterium]MDY6044477.1 aminotransferase class I/II-fold pyridoxal phosphate-dependent enzyme [Peptoniphilus sp.]
MKKNSHGADLYDLEKKYHWSPDDILDFSSNINPLGPSPKALAFLREHVGAASRYPDPEYRKLKAAIADYVHARPEAIVLGSGTSQLIQAYIAHIHPKRALLNSPCYSEYERELDKVGAEIVEYKLDYRENFKIDVDRIIETIRTEDIELYVLTNPNNPTGSILTRVDIERILEETSASILVDETYIEFTDRGVYSAASLATQRDDLFVVRGTSKFFASPGIRLGYGIAKNPDILHALSDNLSMWGINIFAEMMGRVMFSDEAYKAKTYRLVQDEKEKMCAGLEAIDALKVFPSYGNFVLVKIRDRSRTAAELRHALLEKKMVIRDCTNFKNLDERFFRFCLLSEAANDALLKEIRRVFDDAR